MSEENEYIVSLTKKEYFEVAEALRVVWEEIVKGREPDEEFSHIRRILAKFGVECVPLQR